jgi:predicted RNA-binding protein YlxR (DUF448 family)
MELPEAQLLRFVAADDGRIAPDLGGKLGGRGVWVCATRAAVTAAVKRNVFAKSLKRQAKPPPDLADLVEVHMRERLRQALAFANKAGLASFGFAKVEAALDRHEVAVLVQARDAADDGVGRLKRKFSAVCAASGQAVSIVDHLGTDDLGLAFGRSTVVHVALRAGGATDLVIREASRLARFRRDETGIEAMVVETRVERGSSTVSE